jgi:hypothetical protein
LAGRDQSLCRRIALAAEKPLKQSLENRSARFHYGEQRRARSQFHIIRRTKDFVRRFADDCDRSFSAFD